MKHRIQKFCLWLKVYDYEENSKQKPVELTTTKYKIREMIGLNFKALNFLEWIFL
jgi:hypothetical protein